MQHHDGLGERTVVSRRLRVRTNEMGFLELYLIYERAGAYEEYWRPLQAVQ